MDIVLCMQQLLQLDWVAFVVQVCEDIMWAEALFG
jgi:hypothetical protein